MRSDIDKDVVTILDRYSIDAIMDKMIEYLNDKDVVKLKQWCKDNMGTQIDAVGDEIDSLKIRAIQFEIEQINARIERINLRLTQITG